MVILNLGAFKGQAGAITAEAKNPIFINSACMLTSCKGSLKMTGMTQVTASPMLKLFFTNFSLKYAAFSYNFWTLSGSSIKISRDLMAAPVLKALRGALKTAPWEWKV